MQIERKPENKKSADFNTKVVKRVKYIPQLIEKNSFYVNSTSNESFKGGNSKTSLPLKLPANTVERYYNIAASRTDQEIIDGQKNISLVRDLTKALNGIDPTTTALNIGLEMLARPPGADYCDVYLLDELNHSLFFSNQNFQVRPSTTRRNLKSSTVKSDCFFNEILPNKYYLGIKNNDMSHGIHVGIEIVAIVRKEFLDYEVE